MTRPDAPTTPSCKHCGYPGPHNVVDAEAPHYQRLDCGECNRYIKFLPELAKKRSDKNTSHRARWIEAQGGLVCHWCLVQKEQTRAAFHIDHIKPLEFGGVDEFRNTRPLCAACHTIRHALISYQRTLRGQTARSDAA